MFLPDLKSNVSGEPYILVCKDRLPETTNEKIMKSRISSTVAAIGAFVTMGIGLQQGQGGEPIEFRSSETRASLVELFTSEGCSSCPPAERWISGLKMNPKLWKDYVVVAFHVDYWDGLGWKDAFARREFTDRQQTYASQWKTESVYTPGFVVNGKEWRGWFDRESLPEPPAAKAGVLVAKSDKPGVWELSYDAGRGGAGQRLTFSGALLGFGLNSKVKAGENSGRILEHDFVVLKLMTAPAQGEDQLFRAQITLPMNSSSASNQVGVAFWIGSNSNLQPLQAVGGWLDP